MLMLGCLGTSSVVTVKENGGKVTVEAGPLKLTCRLCGTICITARHQLSATMLPCHAGTKLSICQRTNTLGWEVLKLCRKGVTANAQAQLMHKAQKVLR